MSNQTFKHLLLATGLSFACSSFANERIEEIIVTADFRNSTLMEATTSLSVIDQSAIKGRAANQLEEILNLAPNLNYSAGASRGRYMQIRGIGERSQFVDPISPSVGLTIDGIDFSTMGNAAILFDVAQVDLLRGPQGTKFGSSAMAGLVNIQSNRPTEETEALIKAGIGNYGRTELGAVASGALSDEVNARLSINQLQSNGFITNQYLGVDDTNDRDELSARATIDWQINADTLIEATYLHLDIDNGYDAFSLDNNRNTLSDTPGHDRQESDALSLKVNFSGNDLAAWEATFAYQNTETEYGYDEDWTNTGICEGLACDSEDWGFDWWYSSTDNYIRNYEGLELGVRALSQHGAELFGTSSWVAGIYFKDTELDLDRQFFDWDIYADSQFLSTYETTNLALYGETVTELSNQLTLSMGARIEDFDSGYRDSRDVRSAPGETLWGGEISLAYQIDNKRMVYGLISRGYKPGGVNGDALGNAEKNGFERSVIDFLNARLNYETETASNVEAGAKFNFEDLHIRLAAFYMQRDDVQLKGWYNEGPLFVGYTDNGASGSNYGAEIELNYQASESINLFASLGLLQTEIEDFFVLAGSDLVDQTGRDQAHAPNYQFNIGGNILITELLSARVEFEGKDGFYFSDSHDQKSKSFELLHASFSYQIENLELQLWGRNLTDEGYEVRGFYFANDPRDFYAEAEAYTQLGDPRTFGLSATYSF